MTYSEIRSARKARTASHIRTVARRMFQEQGFEAVSLRDVAKAAGLSTGAIFANWSGKEALFASAMGRPHLTDARGAQLLELVRTIAPAQAEAILKLWAA